MSKIRDEAEASIEEWAINPDVGDYEEAYQVRLYAKRVLILLEALEYINQSYVIDHKQMIVEASKHAIKQAEEV